MREFMAPSRRTGSSNNSRGGATDDNVRLGGATDDNVRLGGATDDNVRLGGATHPKAFAPWVAPGACVGLCLTLGHAAFLFTTVI